MTAMLTFVGAVIVATALAAEPVASSSPPPSGLPEIGRVRSTTPACTVMRDLVIPSFAAARRADLRFTETRKRLPDFGELLVDASPHDPMRQTALAKLDADATKLLAEALVINRALGDPRLAADSTDPVVLQERRALQQLYDAQKTRANILWEYVMRKNIALSKAQFAEDPTIGGRRQDLSQDDADKPNRELVVLPGMPPESRTIGFANKQRLAEWGDAIATAIRVNENAAAQTFMPIAQRCS
jgi:hypothetical protein